MHMARDHNAGEQSEPYAPRMGELLPSRNRQQGVSGTRRLRSRAVAPVVALQAQTQATKGRSYPLSHLYGHFGLVRLSRLGLDVSWTKALGLVREPDAGDPHVRFDEGGVETELRLSH